VRLTRREFFLSVGGTAAGSAGITGVESVFARMNKHVLFHDAYAAAVRATGTAPPPSQPNSTIVWSAATDLRRVALTFDDGPHPDWTPRVLEILAKHNVQATFFVRGDRVRDHGELHSDSVGVHEFGNHTWDHPELSLLDYDSSHRQLERTQSIILDRLGTSPTLFRPPFGYLAGSALMAASELRLKTVLWTGRMYDEEHQDDPHGVVDAAVRDVRPGAIWLAHDTGPDYRLVTISYLDEIIRRWKDLGYELTTVSQLIGATVAI
jgi:peptidoglycan-N-acetylglucosamine deacetylase